MSKHYVGEAGTVFYLDCGVVVSSATDKFVKYKTPAGAEGTWSASFYSSYSSIADATGTYFLSHTLIAADLTIPGEWRFQSYIGAIDGTWLGETVKLNIYDEFE